MLKRCESEHSRHVACFPLQSCFFLRHDVFDFKFLILWQAQIVLNSCLASVLRAIK